MTPQQQKAVERLKILNQGAYSNLIAALTAKMSGDTKSYERLKIRHIDIQNKINDEFLKLEPDSTLLEMIDKGEIPMQEKANTNNLKSLKQ